SSTLCPSAISTRAIFPQVVVLPDPFTPTTSSTAGLPSAGVAANDRSRVGSSALTSSSTSIERSSAGSRVPSSLVRARSRSTSSVVASTPTSAMSRVSSTSSQAASSSRSRASRFSSPRPRVLWERAKRARRRTSRPVVGSGRSSTGRSASSGGAVTSSGGAVTSSGGAVTSAGGAVTGPASAGGRGAGGRGRRSFGATRAAPPTSSTASTPSTINRTISGSMPTILSDPVPSAYHGPPNGCVVKYGSDAGAGDRDAARHAVPGPGEPGRDRDLSRRQHRVPTRWFDDHALRTNREHTVPTVGHV